MLHVRLFFFDGQGCPSQLTRTSTIFLPGPVKIKLSMPGLRDFIKDFSFAAWLQEVPKFRTQDVWVYSSSCCHPSGVVLGKLLSLEYCCHYFSSLKMGLQSDINSGKNQKAEALALQKKSSNALDHFLGTDLPSLEIGIQKL